MQQLTVDYATLVAYFALNADILFQILRIYSRKSSHDVSLWGIGIRLAASIILLIKFWAIDDAYLVVGQSLLSIFMITYFVMLIRYRRN